MTKIYSISSTSHTSIWFQRIFVWLKIIFFILLFVESSASTEKTNKAKKSLLESYLGYLFYVYVCVHVHK